ncbi:hypothetical protein CROQUDRAFT_658047 [Cronartium quercuum f. sp. fusiforme G11]|uniref:Cytochrome c oxidase subunit 8, mitochondrial n=1 Tax=Cronartium quercuum f. sp. fusiforme G11 TaxID=708437 RepID=A0A9P6TCS9_9BASI|nr:hypothetical protein CROQUDRAFT_658047 [Cronartium quercuum f. sp. fusiforme G11]
MILTTTTRPALQATRLFARQQTRAMHIENVVGDNLPFKYRGEGQSKAKVGAKVGAFYFIGLFTPFAVARYQMKKSGAWP